MLLFQTPTKKTVKKNPDLKVSLDTYLDVEMSKLKKKTKKRKQQKTTQQHENAKVADEVG